METEGCAVPTLEQQQFLRIQQAAERAMLNKVWQAISDATAEVARGVHEAKVTIEPPGEGYFTFAVQQASFVRLCGGDPKSLQGGDPEIGNHVVRNCRNIIDCYWQHPARDKPINP